MNTTNTIPSQAPVHAQKHLFKQSVFAIKVILLIGSLVIVIIIVPSMLAPSSFSSKATSATGLYVSGMDGIYRFRTENGQLRLLWHYLMKADFPVLYPPVGSHGPGPQDARNRVDTGMVIEQGVVYFGGNDDTGHYLFALNANDGSFRWRVKASLTSTPIVVGDRLYYTSDFGEDGFVDGPKIHALSTRDGSELWSYPYEASGTPYQQSAGGLGAVVNGLVYISISNQLFALHADTGSLAWSIRLDQALSLRPPTVNGKKVYVSSSSVCFNCVVEPGSGENFAFDARNGRQLWHAQPVAGYLSQLVVADGSVYVGSTDGFLYALSAQDGKQIWHDNTDGSVFYPPQVVSGVVYVGVEHGLMKTTDPNVDRGRVLALGAGDGKLHWSYLIPTAGDNDGTPFAVINGYLYGSFESPSIYTLQASNGTLLLEQYPLRRFKYEFYAPDLVFVA